jgi:NMD protein affecting ribosome stability and mRNA decay
MGPIPVDDLMESYEENHCTECGRSLEGGSGRTASRLCDSCIEESR